MAALHAFQEQAMTIGAKNLALHVASGDAFDVREFDVQERMSALFELTLVVVSHNANVDFEGIVGQPARFGIRDDLHKGTPERFWTGICKHIEQTAVEADGLSTYRLALVPVLWLASQRRNHRMFQQITEPDIVLKLLKEWNITSDVRLTAKYKKRKYRVQYAESDYAFISRMLEDAGISFYFEQGDEETRLVLTDAPQQAEPRAKKIAFRDNPLQAAEEHVTKVRIGQQVRPGRYTMRDVDYRKPASYPLLASAEMHDVDTEGRLERFHYMPGAFLFESERGDGTPVADDKGKTRTDEKEGETLAKKRLEAKRANAKVCTFETNALDLTPGVVMRMLDHPRAELGEDKKWLVVASSQRGTSGGEHAQACEARSADVAYRPPVVTPKPKVNGMESATVVGPPGEEIHTDEFGRVRVHFHWDRESRMDEKSSCWLPVSHPWAGHGFGMINLPRVGQEVLVDFLGGDPDRPVIVGRVYTALQPVPYGLPGNKTQSGWKSESSPGGGGFNEIRFEDRKGNEQVYIQAEKDLEKLVKHDETITIGHDRTETVKHDESVTIEHDRVKLVGHDETVTVDNDRTRLVKRNESVTVGKDRTRVVKNDENITIGNNRAKSVAKNERETVGVSRTRVVGVNESVKIGKSQSVKIGGAKSEKVRKSSSENVGLTKSVMVGGMYSVTVGGAMSTTVGLMQSEMVGLVKTVTVGKKIEIKCGDSKIVMESSGKITIEGKEITIKGEKHVGVEAERIDLD
ncbi:type VI secretion system tip protein TssI/VgrG [Polyangium sp. 6x1]|uniref:type VI secretion system Vgr family protein n=1 Tax=Polyangium sp. 6x1 TaxID=3042689 RepID=UPI002482212E|nr:type VI secretion system tip protein TssI/VgrG [Polyangium sp. 6x1]MDI1451770.1 type VI secretion system tip protein TssI/VgrG [Polyangium sp. 6x1]